MPVSLNSYCFSVLRLFLGRTYITGIFQNGILIYLDPDIVGDLNSHRLILNIRDLSIYSAGSYHLISFLQAAAIILEFFLLPHLGPDHEKIKYHDDQQEWK